MPPRSARRPRRQARARIANRNIQCRWGLRRAAAKPRPDRIQPARLQRLPLDRLPQERTGARLRPTIFGSGAPSGLRFVAASSIVPASSDNTSRKSLRARCRCTHTVANFRPVSSAISSPDAPSSSKRISTSRYLCGRRSRTRYTVSVDRRRSRSSIGVSGAGDRARSTSPRQARRSQRRIRSLRRRPRTTCSVIRYSHVVSLASPRNSAQPALDHQEDLVHQIVDVGGRSAEVADPARHLSGVRSIDDVQVHRRRGRCSQRVLVSERGRAIPFARQWHEGPQTFHGTRPMFTPTANCTSRAVARRGRSDRRSPADRGPGPQQQIDADPGAGVPPPSPNVDARCHSRAGRAVAAWFVVRPTPSTCSTAARTCAWRSTSIARGANRASGPAAKATRVQRAASASGPTAWDRVVGRSKRRRRAPGANPRERSSPRRAPRAPADHRSPTRSARARCRSAEGAVAAVPARCRAAASSAAALCGGSRAPAGAGD